MYPLHVQLIHIFMFENSILTTIRSYPLLCSLLNVRNFQTYPVQKIRTYILWWMSLFPKLYNLRDKVDIT